MKLNKGIFANFGSYKTLEFDFNEVGLALITGPTGAGKSTLFDAACWTLYGKTAKNGKSDEVRAWNSKEPTSGTLQVTTKTGNITVTRIRGTQHENDLYYTEEGRENDPQRGKDITETQKLLETRMGVDFDLYTTTSYASDSSPNSLFFLVKPKDRREVLEKIANLSLPVKIAEKCVLAKKEANKAVKELEAQNLRLKAKHEQLQVTMDRTEKAAASWAEEQAKVIAAVEAQALAFDTNKYNKIKELEARLLSYDQSGPAPSKELCPACGACINPEHYEEKLRIKAEISALETRLSILKNQENTAKNQLEIEKRKTTPYKGQLTNLVVEVMESANDINVLERELAAANKRYSDLERLYELSFVLRGKILTDTVADIEDKTNNYLFRYFDGEFSVRFLLEDADKLEVLIQKNSHECTYTQLSRGQRSILRLCFGVAIMEAAANESGNHMDTLFFDEPSDGADPELKVKAYELFEALSVDHSTVLVIDHTSELKEHFTKRFTVTLQDDFSRIEQE
jgi:DNA repair exonuclease SbcCD ATPase subunit